MCELVCVVGAEEGQGPSTIFEASQVWRRQTEKEGKSRFRVFIFRSVILALLSFIAIRYMYSVV